MTEIKKNITIFEKAETVVYGLSVDAPEQSQAVIKEMRLPFELLCDPGRRTVKDWNLFNPFEAGGIARAATFIIDSGGIIRFRALEKTHKRVNIADLVAFLENFGDDADLKSELEQLKLIMPGIKAMGQISRSMFLRGNAANWKHFILFPFEVLNAILTTKGPGRKTKSK